MNGTSRMAAGWRGAWMLLRRNPAGMAQFDLSVEGFWRSFLVPLAIIPFNITALLPLVAESETDFATIAWTRAISDFASLVSFPLLMVPMARFLGLSATYVPFIIANNWASLPIAVAYTALTLIIVLAQASLGPAGVQFVQLWFGLPLLALALVYLWSVARIALRASAGVAAALTLIQYLLALIIERLVELLFG